LLGSKRKRSDVVVAAGVVSSSSSTPISIPSEGTEPSRVAGSGSDHGTEAQSENGAAGNADDEIIVIEPTEDFADTKKKKKCTSDVWQYFTKKEKIIENEEGRYVQMWAYCNFPNCRAKYRCESNQGTTGFRNHLKSAHSVVKGQQQLKSEKDHGRDITVVEPYKYDQEVSLRKFYLAIVMHEYPFNIAQHDYFVEFIESLRPSFPIKSCVTVRKRYHGYLSRTKGQTVFKLENCWVPF
jgi:hypothetical protein